jgi:recombination protein RecR
MSIGEIDALIRLLAKLPGLGPRSARRAALHLLTRKESLLQPLAMALTQAAARIRQCSRCGNLDIADPCGVCTDPGRDAGLLCVVEEIADLWAMERTGAFKGRYHVLGGTLSALDGVGPEDLSIDELLARATTDGVSEVILALGATVDGQTTAHYVADRLAACGVHVSRLAHGMPIGGELNYLDDGTLTAALRARQPVGAG